GLAEREPLAAEVDVAQAFVVRAVVVRGLGGGAEPPLVDAAAVGAERVVVVRVELEAPSGRQERPGNPARAEAQDALALLERAGHAGLLRNLGCRRRRRR